VIKKRLLIIAFHFPPLQGSSGLHRTLSWARNLPHDGWDITILTASSNAYRKINAENASLIPKNVQVIRAPAYDTIRDLSIKGRYPGLLALPDQYQSWIVSACVAGLVHCLRCRPSVILSTYPVASAHYIGRILSGLLRVPWVVDFRDPMAQDDYPHDRRRRRSLHRLERRCIRHASRIFVTTPGTLRLYGDKYPELDADKLMVVPNGYNQSFFEKSTTTERTKDREEIVLLHSGALYRHERDPSSFFEALAALKEKAPQKLERVRVLFRGTGNAGYFEALAERYGVESLVTFGDAVPYRAAISEMLAADGLLILQASNCNEQIPAKIYEYIRARKPILALTDPAGDTAQLLKSCSITSVANLDDPASIEELLVGFLDGDTRRFFVAENFDVDQFSRDRIAMQVAGILETV
jgi:glycosyltransferase involved in cell wall biosynthesis